VRCYAAQATTVASVNLTVGDIAKAFGVVGTDVVDLKVLALTAWNSSGPSTNSNYLRLEGLTNLYTEVGVAVFEDVGTSAALPGIRVNIPDALSALKAGIGLTSAAVACTLSGDPTGNPTARQTFCVDFHVAIRAGV